MHVASLLPLPANILRDHNHSRDCRLEFLLLPLAQLPCCLTCLQEASPTVPRHFLMVCWPPVSSALDSLYSCSITITTSCSNILRAHNHSRDCRLEFLLLPLAQLPCCLTCLQEASPTVPRQHHPYGLPARHASASSPFARLSAASAAARTTRRTPRSIYTRQLSMLSFPNRLVGEEL